MAAAEKPAAAIGAGGAAAVSVVVVILLVGMLFASPLGILFAGEDTGTEIKIPDAVATLNGEFTDEIYRIMEEHPYDELDMQEGMEAAMLQNWRNVLAVYAVKVSTDEEHGLDVMTMDEEKLQLLREIFFDANKLEYELTTRTVDGERVTTLHISAQIKDAISKTRKANHGEAPMYLVENSHPAIISRDIFHRTQEELARRKALRPKSDKMSITQSGKYSKYALSEVLHCAECGSRYKRVTWNIRGKRKIVWRCVSRLDYGKKYCKDSVTLEEAALHGAVVRALNRFHAEDESTYLTLMKATIGEAIGINGGSEEIDLLTRRIDALNKRMLELVNETVAAGKDVESSEEEFKEISNQIEQLTRRIAAIQESARGDATRQARLEEIQDIIARRTTNETQYDDSIVRQMIECIKVHGDGRLTIIFGGGYEIEETL